MVVQCEAARKAGARLRAATPPNSFRYLRSLKRFRRSSGPVHLLLQTHHHHTTTKKKRVLHSRPQRERMRHRSPSLEESYHLIVDGATAAAPQTRAGSTRGEGTPDECVEASFFASPHAPVSGGSFRVHRSSSAISSDHRADNERGERGARVPLLSDADDREGDVPPHLTRLRWYQVRD